MFSSALCDGQWPQQLQPQGETKVPSYAEIKAAREAVIRGLQEALDTLAGVSVPAFVQINKRDGPMETIGEHRQVRGLRC